MTKKERNDWQKWWWFLGRRVREFTFLGAWVGMAWSLDVYIISSFPVDGPPKYMLLAFESLFDISTLVELIMLLYLPHQPSISRWLQRRRQ